MPSGPSDLWQGLTRVTSGERWAPSHSRTIALETFILHPEWSWWWMFTFHTFHMLLWSSMYFCVTMSPRTAAWQAANANLVDLTPDASSMTSSSSSRGAGILTSRAPNEVYRPRHRARCSGRFRPSKICVYCQSLPPCKWKHQSKAMVKTKSNEHRLEFKYVWVCFRVELYQHE